MLLKELIKLFTCVTSEAVLNSHGKNFQKVNINMSKQLSDLQASTPAFIFNVF